MRKPSFFRPLLKVDQSLANVLGITGGLLAQIRAANSTDLESLEELIIKIRYDLVGVQSEVLKARGLEFDFRNK